MMIINTLLPLLLIVILFITKMASSFNILSRRIVNKSIVSMEYIPDGLSKAQW